MKFGKPACSTCPFRRDGDRSKAFDPAELRRTVVDYLNRRDIHPCHANGAYACAGYMAFLKAAGWLWSAQMVRIAARLGLFDESQMPDVQVFGSIREMLADHRLRLTGRRTQRRMKEESS